MRSTRLYESNEINFDNLLVLDEDSEHRKVISKIVAKYEGFSIDIYDNENLLFSELIYVYQGDKREECVILVTSQFIYLISVLTQKLVYDPPISFKQVEEYISPQLKDLNAYAFKLSNYEKIGQSHIILEKFLSNYLQSNLTEFIKSLKLKMSFTFLIT